MSFVIAIPLAKPLPSLANARLHWSAKARIVKSQRLTVRLAMRSAIGSLHYAMAEAQLLECPLAVRFVRVASRQLDDDNLAAAFKAMRDEVAALAGVDDGSARWRWEYAQERGASGVRVEVEVRS